MNFMLYFVVGILIDYITTTIQLCYWLAKENIVPPKWWYVLLIPIINTYDSMMVDIKGKSAINGIGVIASVVAAWIMWPICIPIAIVFREVYESSQLRHKEES